MTTDQDTQIITGQVQIYKRLVEMEVTLLHANIQPHRQDRGWIYIGDDQFSVKRVGKIWRVV